ncbi:MAG: hypothetical protein GY777_29185 [Candidatus Brocadiaceae bacterium]|nr:hypothetical protein [Candidatus Brocadiaceae bacterium]
MTDEVLDVERKYFYSLFFYSSLQERRPASISKELDGCKKLRNCVTLGIHLHSFMTGSWDEALKSIQHHLLNKFDGKVDETPERFLQLEITRKGGLGLGLGLGLTGRTADALDSTDESIVTPVVKHKSDDLI